MREIWEKRYQFSLFTNPHHKPEQEILLSMCVIKRRKLFKDFTQLEDLVGFFLSQSCYETWDEEENTKKVWFCTQYWIILDYLDFKIKTIKTEIFFALNLSHVSHQKAFDLDLVK